MVGGIGTNRALGRNRVLPISGAALATGSVTREKLAADVAGATDYARLSKIGLAAPNPRSRRGFPTVMTTPPTIGTLNAAYTGGSNPNPTASVISSATRYMPSETSAYRYFAGDAVHPTGWQAPAVIGEYFTAASAAPDFRVDFEADCSQIEILAKSEGQAVTILVDGQLIGDPIDLGSTGLTTGIPLTFSGRGVRRITVITRYFWGVMLGPNDTIWRSAAPLGPRVIVIGDSFTDGTGVTIAPGLNGYSAQLGFLRGWEDVWASGVGGTGYLQADSGNVNYRDRLQADVVSRAPDIVIVTGGINDHANFSASAIQTEAALLFAAIRAGLPNAHLVVILPFWKDGSPVESIVNTKIAIRTAATGVADAVIDPIGVDVSGANTSGWITGTGRVGSTTGAGNADLYTSTDGTHPSSAGHRYLAGRIDAALGIA